jgi:predicted enzyme related to lactoylglutathione lyase
MMRIDDSWGDVPPNWSVYIMVDDVDATVTKTQDLGGNVLMPATAAGEMGRFAMLQDPQSAVFSVMEFAGETSPPPGA